MPSPRTRGGGSGPRAALRCARPRADRARRRAAPRHGSVERGPALQARFFTAPRRAALRPPPRRRRGSGDGELQPQTPDVMGSGAREETGAAAHGKEKRPRSGGGRHPSEQLRPPPGTSRSARGRRPRVPPRVRATVCALSGGCHSEGAGRLCIKPGARRFSEAPRQPLRSTG
ncbi:unnamed protein product [Prorocentrum cordatum]|uniref:Uncharacterized protein n=1 Tax=Prorocentrum cordatum TaxID=2364126 RepID=A0ABN9RMX9_9DINO|nr:unnamed protein product [Polarella glacialis]